MQGARIGLLQRFFELPGHQQQCGQRIQDHRHQSHLPAPVLTEKTAHRRAGAGHQTQTGHGLGHDTRTFGRFVQIAHHSARAGDDRAHGNALKNAPADQHFNVGAHHTADGRDQVQAQTQQHDGASAHFVRKRTPQQLRGTESQQQTGQGVLHHADAGFQICRQSGQGG